MQPKPCKRSKKSKNPKSGPLPIDPHVESNDSSATNFTFFRKRINVPFFRRFGNLKKTYLGHHRLPIGNQKLVANVWITIAPLQCLNTPMFEPVSCMFPSNIGTFKHRTLIFEQLLPTNRYVYMLPTDFLGEKHVYSCMGLQSHRRTKNCFGKSDAWISI